MFNPKDVTTKNVPPQGEPGQTPTPQISQEQQVAEQQQVLEAQTTYQEGVASIRDLIAPASLKVTPYHLELNGKFARTLFVFAYPRFLSVGWFSPVINFPAPIDISMYFYQLSSETVLKKTPRQSWPASSRFVYRYRKRRPPRSDERNRYS